jgi:hypothetical protein
VALSILRIRSWPWAGIAERRSTARKDRLSCVECGVIWIFLFLPFE